MAGVADPFAERDALVSVGTEPLSGDLTPNAMVNGTAAVYIEGVEIGLGAGAVNQLRFSLEAHGVVMSSRHLDLQAMVELAEALRLDGDEVVLDRADLGLNRIGPTVRTMEFRSVGYRDTGADSRGAAMVDLASRSGDETMLAQLLWTGAKPTKVAGHLAMLTEQDLGTFAAFNLTWMLADGVILSVNSARSEAEARALARRVQQVSEAEWNTLRQTAMDEQFRQSQPSGSSVPVTTTSR